MKGLAFLQTLSTFWHTRTIIVRLILSDVGRPVKSTCKFGFFESCFFSWSLGRGRFVHHRLEVDHSPSGPIFGSSAKHATSHDAISYTTHTSQFNMCTQSCV